MYDRHSTVERQALEIDILKAEKKRLEMSLDTANSNLESIFERVKDGEEVYLCYPDGNVLYLTGSSDKPK